MNITCFARRHHCRVPGQHQDVVPPARSLHASNKLDVQRFKRRRQLTLAPPVGSAPACRRPVRCAVLCGAWWSRQVFSSKSKSETRDDPPIDCRSSIGRNETPGKGLNRRADGHLAQDSWKKTVFPPR
jgi:hypothetical protein